MAEIFAFKRRIAPNGEGFVGATLTLRTEGQTPVSRALEDYPEYMARVTLLFDDSSSTESLDAWRAFYFSHFGGTLFKFKAGRAAYREVDGEAVGSYSGSETLLLDKKYIDATTLKVYVDAVEQTSGVDYSLVNNETAPEISPTGTFDSGVVTADYEYYIPCRLVSAPSAAVLVHGEDLASPGVDELVIALAETGPGAHLA